MQLVGAHAPGPAGCDALAERFGVGELTQERVAPAEPLAVRTGLHVRCVPDCHYL